MTEAMARGRWRGMVFVAFFTLIAFAAVFSHRAYALFLLVLLAAIDWPDFLRGGFRKWAPTTPWAVFGIAAAAFCIWTLVSALWSPLPQKADWSWRYGFALGLAALAFRSVDYLSSTSRVTAAKALAWGVFAMGALLTFEAATGGLIRRLTPPEQIIGRDYISLGRGALLLSVLVWPARDVFAHVLNRPRLGWLTLALAIPPALAFTIESNVGMLTAGSCAFAAAYAFGRKTVPALLIFAIAALFLTPLAAILLPLEQWADGATNLPSSWLQRMHIYARAGGEIAAHPFGGGVEYARFLSRPIVEVVINGEALNTMPLHPHNLSLHIWMDLGVIGVASVAGLVIAILLAVGALDLSRGQCAMLAAVAAAFIVSATTEWSLWQVWRLAAVWIALIACRLAIGVRRPQ